MFTLDACEGGMRAMNRVSKPCSGWRLADLSQAMLRFPRGPCRSASASTRAYDVLRFGSLAVFEPTICGGGPEVIGNSGTCRGRSQSNLRLRHPPLCVIH